jgi:membrane-associated protein
VIAPLILGIDWLDPATMLDRFGDYALWGAAAIVFAECGLLIGFFLPGDSLLFTVGLLVAQDKVSYPLWVCCLVLFAASMLGNACGYLIGDRFGPSVFKREDSRLFKKQYVEKTHDFFERYGSRAIVLARFVPVVRTFITVMAGVGTMSFRKYMTYSAVGGLLWAAGVTALGYYLGSIPFVRDNVEVMILAFVAIAVVPVAVEMLRERASRKLAELTED